MTIIKGPWQPFKVEAPPPVDRPVWTAVAMGINFPATLAYSILCVVAAASLSAKIAARRDALYDGFIQSGDHLYRGFHEEILPWFKQLGKKPPKKTSAWPNKKRRPF